jgi:hypothetical protein
MNLNIPKKGANKKGEELFNHQVRLTGEKTIKFARVREVLGGYSAAELLEILVDMAIEQYNDGTNPNPDLLPKGLELPKPEIKEEEAEQNA